MNILIIDDEPLILQNVHRQLQRMNLDSHCIFMASGAEEARKVLEKADIQIFLCDIVMPQEDGITFAKWVLGRYPHSKFIFLTAHSDFAYMKEAISMQSFDYVLQPVSDEDLQNVVRRAIAQVTIEEKQRNLFKSRSFLIDNETDILEGNSIRCLTGFTDRMDYLKGLIENHTGTINANTQFFPAYVYVVNGSRKWEEKDKGLLRSIYYNMLEELFEPLNIQPIVIIRSDLSGNAFVLLRLSDEKPDHAALLHCLENFRVLNVKLAGTEMALYYTTICSFDDIPARTKELLEAEKCDIAKVCELSAASRWIENIDEQSLDVQLGSWKILLNRNLFEDVKKSISKYLDYQIANKNMNREFMLKVHAAVSELILGKAATDNMDMADIFDEEHSYYDFMYCFDDVQNFRNRVFYILDVMKKQLGISDGNPVEQVINYIHDHLEQDVSVAELSDMVGLNPEYFTKLFKKATGYTLKRYMVQEKLEAAKHLLLTTSLPITIIAEHVGYSNYSNFTHTFRQSFGCSPSEFRNEVE